MTYIAISLALLAFAIGTTNYRAEKREIENQIHFTAIYYIGLILSLESLFHCQGKEWAKHKFLNGECFKFYLLLKDKMSQTQAYYDSDHVICKIGNKYYDASGEVDKGRHLPMKKHYPELYKEWSERFKL